jgi:alkyl sulfatase BDS1-like metallo-beta-lactamase superfamily hydrolase
MTVSKARTALCALLALSSASLCAQDWTHYERDPAFKPSTLPNGAVSNISAWQKVQPLLRIGEGVQAKAVSVTKNTWVITGYFYGPVIVETDSGLLVFSSGENTEDGSKFRQIIREQISKKPIIALFYDHAHYAKGASTLLDGDQAMIVAHPDSNRILADSGSLANPHIPELLPTLDGRAAIHFGNHHPSTGPDAKMAGASLELGRKSGWMPATKTLADGETMSVGGITIQAFHAITDTEDSLTFWLPDRKLVIDNVLWPTVPNLYTLRGDRYRDPQDWMKALRKIRELQPEVEICVGGGSLPLVGKEKIRDASNALLDTVAFIYDQSIRLTNLGVPMDELGKRIHMPESLLKHPYVNEAYGQFETWPEAIAQRSHGWFSGYAEDIHSLPRKDYAENFIKLAGGPDNVLQAYNEAMTKGEYLWAKDLASEL